MNLELRARHVVLDPTLRELCERHLLHSLGRLEERIRRVQLWIEDLNGPRGGRDTRCRLRVSLRRGGTFAVQAVAVAPEAAVAEAFDRARSSALRLVQRQRRAPSGRRLLLLLS